MKRIFLLLPLLLAAVVLVAPYAVAQKIVTIPQIQMCNIDSLKKMDQLQNNAPLYLDDGPYTKMNGTIGDTVKVTGYVIVPPRILTYTLGRYNLFIQDTTTGQLWAGLNVLTDDTTSPGATSIGLTALDSGYVVSIVGRVFEYGSQPNSLTEMFAFKIGYFEQSAPVEILDIKKRPQPVEVAVDSFATLKVPKISSGEKYEGMYVVIRNVKVVSVDYSTGRFTFADANGNEMTMYDGSGWYTLRGHKFSNSRYSAPPVGTTLKYIRGVILPQARSGTAGEYNIMPLYPGPSQLSGSKYPGDVVIDKFAPSITNFTKYPGVPKSTDVVNITYRAKDPNTNGPVDSTLFCYKVGLAGSWVKTKVTTPDSIYRATIPASANDSIVSYYVEAYASGQIGMFPDASIPYFYRIRNTGLTIYDLQYTPYVNGRSGFTGDTVTVTGVLVLDTTMFKENVSRPRFYMSSGTGAWKGICMYGINAAVGLDTLKKADSVSVTGILRESYSKTEIQVLSYVLLKRGATVPAANSVSISGSGSLSYEITNPPVDGTARFEQWEGCLITISNPYVVVRNADNPSGGAGSNYGEFFVSSSALGTANAKYGIRVNDYGTYKYYADTSASYTAKEPNPILLPLGCKISFITGVLDYSYSNYKLEPRDNNDFGTITSVEPKRIAAPADYELSQNYPNPFNPTTEIRYSIPSNNRVTIKIYNILGQVVRTVVDADHAAGTYAARFNANGLASGMYIYQMKAGDYVVAKKMMLLK